VIGVGTTNLFSADITNILALSGSAAILSLLMSLDRREALLTDPPVIAPVDPAAADYQPAVTFTGSGCGGDLR
jgi:hypothetical protein